MPLVLQLNLKRKAALFVAVILVAVVTGVSLTLVLTAIPVIRHSDLAGAVSVGRQIVKDVRLVMDFGMALGDMDQVPEMLEEAVRRNPGLGYLCVTDAAGKLYYRSALVPADLPAATTLLNHPAGSDDKPSPDVRIRLGGESFHDVAVPLRTADGAFKAVVHLGTRASVREKASAVAEINQHVSEIASGAENVASATTELSISGRLVADSAEANAGRAEEARGAAAQISRGGESIGALAERSREQVAERVSAAAAPGNEAVGRTLAGIESIRDEVRATEETMRALQESAGSIGRILGVIDDIADQTDLLALNASILSAQAGEHGRGFGVVAGEIRTLSTRTSESTRRIATLIESVQTGAKRTSQSLQRVAGSVETGLGLGQRAQRSLEAVAASVEESAGIVREIARVTGEQERGGRVIAETAERVRQIAVEFAAGTGGRQKLTASIAEAMTALRGLAGEHAALVGELAGTARRMNELSKALRRELAVFHPASPAL